MTIPEQAVQAAAKVICAHDNEQWGDSSSTDVYFDLVSKMLTAAAPHLAAVRVKVRTMETAPSSEGAEKPSVIEVHEGAWAIVKGTNGKDAGWVDTHDLFAQQLYRHHVLSALEPSAGRAAVLEEAAQVVDAKAEEYEKEASDLRGSDRDRRFCSAVAVRLRGSANEIRALHPVSAPTEDA